MFLFSYIMIYIAVYIFSKNYYRDAFQFSIRYLSITNKASTLLSRILLLFNLRVLRAKDSYYLPPRHHRSPVKAISVRNFTFLFYPRPDNSKMTVLFRPRDLFYPSVPRHRPSIISAQERNRAVPRRMQSPHRTGLIVRNKEKNNGAPTFSVSFIGSNAAAISVRSRE